MIKKLLSLAMLAVTAIAAFAQTPLPLNKDVKHGTLPNGLNYYILHNEEPKNRVNFYIAQKVGSTLETPEQLGLAHFLEHMAFNGTKNYPGKNMLNYLQSKGIRFGNDINAYTSFDETVYNIDNVPADDKALMDSVLLVLYDWSGSILLEEDEINAERGVIEEEWRSRNSASQRMYESFLKDMYQEYQYQQMPIGKMEIVRNFPPEAIRSYYEKWYRPDQQGIVIVGDMDAAEMEQKVIKLFSTIPMPENAAARTYPDVSDNKEPIFTYFKDKEQQYPMALIFFKSDKMPFEMRNTVEYYMQENVIFNIMSLMLNNRLSEYSKKPECKYLQASASFGDYFVAKTKAAFQIVVVAKDDTQAAIQDAMAIVTQACKTGFMESELVRARDELLASYEKAYNERNKTNSATLARELCRHFIDNEPAPGIETEYELMQQVLQMIPVAAYNEVGKEILTAENQVVAIAEPDREGMTVVTRENIITALENTLNADYEPYVDEVITDPLIEKLPKPGKVSKTEAGDFDSQVFTLSNGVKVIVKKTDYKEDEVMFEAYKLGGRNIYPESQAADVLLSGDAFDLSKMGGFDVVKLQKYLAGKNVSLGFEIGSTSTVLNGRSTVKDLPTFMEILYSSFTQLNPDATAYQTEMDKAKSALKNMDKNQNQVFQKMVSAATYGNNPMFQSVTPELIDAANYDREFKMIKSALADASDYTFFFVGNVDAETLKPLLEQYVATLPVAKKKAAAPKAITSIEMAKGQVNDFKTMPMAAPATMVYVNANGYNLNYNVENDVKISLIGDLLSNKFTETLREEEGGTYSPYAYGNMNPWNKTWSIIYIFITNDQVQDKLIARANEEMTKLLQNGTDEVSFNKVREAAIKQYENKIRTNGYWLNGLYMLSRGYDMVSTHKVALENLTLADLNKFMSTLYDGKNHIQVVLQGVNE